MLFSGQWGKDMKVENKKNFGSEGRRKEKERKKKKKLLGGVGFAELFYLFYSKNNKTFYSYADKRRT